MESFLSNKTDAKPPETKVEDGKVDSNKEAFGKRQRRRNPRRKRY